LKKKGILPQEFPEKKEGTKKERRGAGRQEKEKGKEIPKCF